MTRTQGLLVVATCVLLAAWLAFGGSRAWPRAAVPQAPSPAASADSPDPVVERIGSQAERLRAHLASAAPLAPSRRNLFRFREPTIVHAPGARPERPVLGAALVERPAARPEMALVGVAEDVQDGRTVRTAVISAMNELLLVKEGERLLARYQVLRIAADVVQLKDGEETFTLALK